MTISLKSGGRVYGILSVPITAEMASDADEQSLLSEVADDIAFSLHRIELEEKGKQTEEALRESGQNFRDLVENMLDGVAIADENA